MASGIVTEVQRFCLDDGPGIRTTVFLKGCPLRCPWCHNPEAIAPESELMFYRENCIACGQCVVACAAGVHEITEQAHEIRRDRCGQVGDCIRSCPRSALHLAGCLRSDEDVMAEIMEDRVFYASGGGATLSGGEPMQQPEFAGAILRGCQEAGIHTAVETSLCYPWARLSPLLDCIDLVIFDVKMMEAERHRRFTGVSNLPLWQNLDRLNDSGKPLIARTPVIAGVNDGRDEADRIATALGRLNHLLYYELLPYQPFGAGKHVALGRPIPEFSAPTAAALEELAAIGRARNLQVRIGGMRGHAHELRS